MRFHEAVIDMTDIQESLQLVSGYLASFYRDEENDSTAAKNAVHAGVNDRPYIWRLSRAFREVLGATLPDGTLQRLVVTVARRNVWSEDEAREFLQKVYDDAYLDDVAGFDDED
jgi:hypothetical protein